MERSDFREWCIVELMGHSQIAGLVSEQALGGETFIRVDVPETSRTSAFTKMYGKGAIYAITPTDETTARAFIASVWQPPVNHFTLQKMLVDHALAGDNDNCD